MYAARGRNRTFHVECDVSSLAEDEYFTRQKRRKSNFDRLLDIIVSITDT